MQTIKKLVIIGLISFMPPWAYYFTQSDYFVSSALVRIGYVFNFTEQVNTFRPLIAYDEAQNILRSYSKWGNFENGSLYSVTYLERTHLLEIHARGASPKKAMSTFDEIVAFLNNLYDQRLQLYMKQVQMRVEVFDTQIRELKKELAEVGMPELKESLSVKLAYLIQNRQEFRSVLDAPNLKFDIFIEPKEDQIRRYKPLSFRVAAEISIALFILLSLGFFYFRGFKLTT